MLALMSIALTNYVRRPGRGITWMPFVLLALLLPQYGLVGRLHHFERLGGLQAIAAGQLSTQSQSIVLQIQKTWPLTFKADRPPVSYPSTASNVVVADIVRLEDWGKRG